MWILISFALGFILSEILRKHGERVEKERRDYFAAIERVEEEHRRKLYERYLASLSSRNAGG